MTKWVVLLAAALVAGVNLWIAYDIHEAAQREQARCAADLSRELALKPYARAWGLPADPCLALRAVRVGQ